MNEKDKAEISADLNRMLMEMYDRGIADAEAEAMKAIEAAVLAEREACAKSVYDSTDWAHEERDMVLKEAIAAAIRARGEK